MDNDQKAYLEVEADKGDRAARAMDAFFDPFFEAKSAELFEAFKSTSTSAPESLMLIKMQVNALESLKDELEHHINTGKMAKQSLSDEEEQE